jgi:hypothetical protein
MHRLVDLLAAPLQDYTAALDAAFPKFRISSALAIIGGFAVSWWIYVPIHELLHAYGCILTGGEVTRLEISPEYGAAWLQAIFPFVAVGSDYAGQLTGFETYGNDWIYLATDFLPFVLTILVGIPLLRSATWDQGRPLRAAFKLGVAMPLAYAPFISLTGDYYEMGSILVSRAASKLVAGFDPPRWRSDDLFKLAGELSAGDGSALDVVGLSLSFVAGIALIYLTYGAGMLCADRLVGEPRRL